MIIISLGVLTTQECEAPRPARLTPKTLHGLLSLPFIASIPHSAIPSPTRLGSQGLQSVHHPVPWEEPAQPGPSQPRGRPSSDLETRAPGFPREAGRRPWPGALSHGPFSVRPVCGPGALSMPVQTRIQVLAGPQTNSSAGPEEVLFCFALVHCFTCPTLPKLLVTH